VKFSNHHIQSPLLDIANSCGVCHRWSEDEIRGRVESIQTRHFELKLKAEDALVKAHFDIAACRQLGATPDEVAPLQDLVWRSQLRWDYVSATNGMGFHSPQESARVLGTSLDLAHEVRVQASRLMAAKGLLKEPDYPDISTQEAALKLIVAFEDSAKDPSVAPPRLIP